MFFTNKETWFFDKVSGSRITGLFLKEYLPTKRTKLLILNIFRKIQKKISIFQKEPKIFKKIYTSNEKFIIDVKNLTFSSYWSSGFITITALRQSQRVKIYFENSSIGRYRAVIPTLREYQKVQIVMNFLAVASLVSPRTQGPILSSRLEPKAFHYYIGIPLHFFLFSALRQIPYRLVM